MRAFLSFATADKPFFETFKSRIERQHPDVELLAHAVKGRHEDDCRRVCAAKIDRSEFLICLVGVTNYRSKAVPCGIDRGLSLGKRIVAVKLSADAVGVPLALPRHVVQLRESFAGTGLSPAVEPALER